MFGIQLNRLISLRIQCSTIKKTIRNAFWNFSMCSKQYCDSTIFLENTDIKLLSSRLRRNSNVYLIADPLIFATKQNYNTSNTTVYISSVCIKYKIQIIYINTIKTLCFILILFFKYSEIRLLGLFRLKLFRTIDLPTIVFYWPKIIARAAQNRPVYRKRVAVVEYQQRVAQFLVQP